MFCSVNLRKFAFATVTVLVWVMSTFAQTSKPKKVYMVTDLEGVDGIFDSDLQCLPYKSPRWEESHKLLTGEVNAAVDGLLAGGDTAACKEIHDFVPQAECAEVKSGVSRTAGYMLSHPAACALIREKAQRAWERLAEFKPFDPAGPVEIKVEFTTRGEPAIHPREGVERLNERTWVFRGRDIVDAWLRWSSL